MRNRKKFFLQKVTIRNTLTFITGTLALLALAWLGDQSYFWKFDRDEFKADAFFGALIVFIISSFSAAYLAFDYVKVKTLNTKSVVSKAKVLIMSVSTISPWPKKEIKKHEGIFKLFVDGHEKISFTGIIEQDITLLENLKSQNIKVNWQQTLRAIQPHIGELEKVVLVYSKELADKTDESEQSQLMTLMDWLSLYGQRQDKPELQEFTVHRHTAPVDKDKMDDYYTAFDEQIDIAADNGTDDKHIIVDITGGQVPASIGGSLATLHNNCTMQYVNDKGSIKVYDAGIEQVNAKT